MYDYFRSETDKELFDKVLSQKYDVSFIDKRSSKYRIKSKYNSFTPFLKDYFYNVKNLGAVNTFQDFDGYIR